MKANRKKRSGFTLIEALIAMAILGFAITALLMANRSFSSVNGAGLKMSTAEFLTEQIREQTVTIPFSGLAGSGPSNVAGYPGYSQKTTVEYVTASDLGVPSASPTAFRRITVDISLNNELISSTSWIRANY